MYVKIGFDLHRMFIFEPMSTFEDLSFHHDVQFLTDNWGVSILAYQFWLQAVLLIPLFLFSMNNDVFDSHPGGPGSIPGVGKVLFQTAFIALCFWSDEIMHLFSAKRKSEGWCYVLNYAILAQASVLNWIYLLSNQHNVHYLTPCPWHTLANKWLLSK